MKDEIKEILDYFKNYVNDKYETYTVVSRHAQNLKILLDYITNLQEKVNQYENPDDMTLMFMWCDEKAKDKIKQLQEENERLKLELSGYREAILRNDKLLGLQNYKSRNEKAIRYMNNTFIITSIKEFYEHLDNIESILQGEDKK